ncbi:MAG: hypothetical protein ACI80H_001283 [Pseudoalteromonas distincta]|jgi:hypothetical protein
MTIHIDLENPKGIALLEYLRSLDYVTIDSEYEIPESHKAEAMDAKAEYDINPSQGKTIKETIEAIKKAK